MTSLAREFQLGERDFAWVRDEVKSRAGISLGAHKKDLVYNRLASRLRALGLTTFADYRRIIEGGDPGEVREFVNALTTNVTAFFREPHHFELLKERVLPELSKSGARRARFWCAGCSSGEEPYTLAMTLHESLGARIADWDLKILATDIDTDVLAFAEEGIYPASRVEGLGEQRLRRFFLKGKGSREGAFRARDELRELVTFRRLNLMEALPMKRSFDVVFCRNVIIYFDRATQRQVIDRMADLLNVGGYLFLGHSESCSSERHQLDPLGRTAFLKRGAAR